MPASSAPEPDGIALTLCTECPCLFENADAMRSHRSKAHTDDACGVCDGRGRTFVRRDDVATTLCGDCARRFVRLDEAEQYDAIACRTLPPN